MLENSDLYSIKCFLLSLKFTKIAGNWAPDPTGGAYSAPPDPLAVIGWDRDLVAPPWNHLTTQKVFASVKIKTWLRPWLRMLLVNEYYTWQCLINCVLKPQSSMSNTFLDKLK